MITELKEQLNGEAPAAIVVSVGGGGLMCGILEGMRQVGWSHVPLIAVETKGADSLNACVRANDWVALADITRYVGLWASRTLGLVVSSSHS